MHIPQAPFPRMVASRSLSPPILSQSVFRCLNIARFSIDGGRLGHFVPLDRGVEADYVVRSRRVSLCTSHRTSAAAPHNKSSSCSSSKLPFFLAHTVGWVRTYLRIRCPSSGYSFSFGGLWLFLLPLGLWPWLSSSSLQVSTLSPSPNSISSIWATLVSSMSSLAWFSSYLLYMGGSSLALLAPLSLAAVLCERAMLPYQTSADKALWLTFDKFAVLVHQKLQEKQIELLDLKGHPLSESNFTQIQWDARVTRRTNNLCEERLIVCIDYLS